MKVTIIEVSDPKEALLALGLKTFLTQLGIESTPSLATDGILLKGMSPAAQPAIAKPAAAGPGSAPAAPARTSGDDPRGSRRDAVRAALRSGAKTIEAMTTAVQATFPEMQRTDVGTVLVQLSKMGECELGADRFWRSSK